MTEDITYLTDSQKRLIQGYGVSMEQTRMAPAEARILALLMVSAVPELTFEQIQETLQLSRSAVRHAIDKLLVTHRIEYITHHADRKRYFKVRIDTWNEKIKQSLEILSEQSKLVKEILETRPESTKEFNNHLKETVEFTEFLSIELHLAYEKWLKRKEGKSLVKTIL